MKIKRVVLSRIGPFLFLAALLLYPFPFTAAFAQEMPDVIGVRMTDGSVIEGTGKIGVNLYLDRLDFILK